MASPTTDLSAELDAFAAPFVQSGRYASTTEVVHAAMDAFRLSQSSEEAINKALSELAEEGEASGEIKGDIFEHILAKYTLNQNTGS